MKKIQEAIRQSVIQDPACAKMTCSQGAVEMDRRLKGLLNVPWSISERTSHASYYAVLAEGMPNAILLESDKAIAEHIVKVHNESLGAKK